MRALSIIVAIAWFFSFTRTLLHLRVIPRLRAGQVPLRTPLVSVIVPARNEERVVGQTVSAWLAQTYAPFELVVVNDRSSDRTGEILHAVDDSRLLVVDGEEPPPGWLGKPWALHEGSLRARGELLLFVDADVFYAPEALQALVAYQQRTDARVVALLPHFEMRGFWENAAMPQLALTALTFLPLWLSNRTRIGALAIGAGPGNLVARSDYVAVGGHEALRDSVVDDIALARLVRRKLHQRTEAIRAEGLVSLRMYHGLGEIIDGFTKNFFFAFGRSYVAGVLALLAGFVFHLLPYLLALRGDPYAIATVALITLTRLVLFGSLRYSLRAAVFLHPVMIAVWGYITLRSMWYTGVRRQLLWRGRTYDAGESRFGADR